MRKNLGIAALGIAALVGPAAEAQAATSHSPAVVSSRVAAEDQSDNTSNVGKWGLPGLLGLLGLAGLARAMKSSHADNGSTRFDAHR